MSGLKHNSFNINDSANQWRRLWNPGKKGENSDWLWLERNEFELADMDWPTIKLRNPEYMWHVSKWIQGSN